MTDGGYGAGYSAGYSDGANSVGGGGEGYSYVSTETPEEYRAYKRKRRAKDALTILVFLVIAGVIIGVLWTLVT
jgi:hypothetical protein